MSSVERVHADDALRIVRTAMQVCEDLDRPAMAEDLESVELYIQQTASLTAAQQPVQDGGGEYPEAAQVCAEAYQVVGSLLGDLGIFGTERADKILDNLSQHKLVHKDALPWPSFEKPAPPSAPVGTRPSRDVAEIVIGAYLLRNLGAEPEFELTEDGEDGWAFWITADGAEGDTTSYLHADLRVEWLGTCWEANALTQQPAQAAPGDDDSPEKDVAVWELIRIAEECGAQKDSDDDHTWWSLDLHAFYKLEDRMTDAVSRMRYTEAATPPGDDAAGGGA